MIKVPNFNTSKCQVVSLFIHLKKVHLKEIRVHLEQAAISSQCPSLNSSLPKLISFMTRVINWHKTCRTPSSTAVVACDSPTSPTSSRLLGRPRETTRVGGVCKYSRRVRCQVHSSNNTSTNYSCSSNSRLSNKSDRTRSKNCPDLNNSSP